MKKPIPKHGDNFRLVGDAADAVLKDVEQVIENVKRRGKDDAKPTKQPKR